MGLWRLKYKKIGKKGIIDEFLPLVLFLILAVFVIFIFNIFGKFKTEETKIKIDAQKLSIGANKLLREFTNKHSADIIQAYQNNDYRELKKSSGDFFDKGVYSPTLKGWKLEILNSEYDKIMVKNSDELVRLNKLATATFYFPIQRSPENDFLILKLHIGNTESGNLGT